MTTPTDTISEIAVRVLELDERATRGPWVESPREEYGPEGNWGVWQVASGGEVAWVGDPYPRGDNSPYANMQLIACYRTAAPQLAAEVIRLRAAIASTAATMRAREEAPNASTFTWDYVMACVFDDGPGDEAASAPIDRWSIRTLRALVAIADEQEPT